MINKIEKIAKKSVLEAGTKALKEFDKFDRNEIELKLHKEAVTKVDLASEKILIKNIKNSFKEHKILSEEAGEVYGKEDYLWIIDPIDGTTNFTMHNPIWSISVGVAYKGEIIFGVIYAPFLREIYIAKKSEGAFRYKVKDNKICNRKEKLSVSNFTKGKLLNTYCHARDQKSLKTAINYYSKLRLNEIHCHQLGSAAVELAFVASGRTESIMIPGVHAWDVAAGILLVREAGGKVTDLEGKKWNLKSKGMLASNGKIHNMLLQVVKTC